VSWRKDSVGTKSCFISVFALYSFVPKIMPTPAFKKRKLDSTAALSRPFKSPLKRSQPVVDTDGKKENAPRKEAQPQHVVQESKDLHATPAKPHESTSFRRTNAPTSRFSPISSPLQSDPEIAALQRQHAALVSVLATLATEFDTITQALKIEASGRDAELQDLCQTWKGVARQAAEEIYGSVRERINRMGGVGAWREREKGMVERKRAWEEEDRIAQLEQELQAVEDAEEEEDGYLEDVEVREERKERLRNEMKSARNAKSNEEPLKRVAAVNDDEVGGHLGLGGGHALAHY
jgi:hypothetical protein